MVKVGDRVKVVGYRGFLEDYDFKGKEGVVIQMNNGSIVIETDSGYKRYGDERDVEVIVAAPPKKIQQNGYEYELVGPVKPNWLVDGAWVVNAVTEHSYQIIEGEPGLYRLKRNGKTPFDVSLDRILNNYRPHTASDWKWGDWALHEGKRVFVMRGTDCDGDITISGIGLGITGNNYTYAKPSELTPTF